ncbi:MAG: universal stress protein [Solirubrobacteraceae bacterium]
MSEPALLERRARSGVEAHLRWRQAPSVGQGLQELCEEIGPDLLVVGSSRCGLLGRVLLGDDTRAALTGAPCAIAIARRIACACTAKLSASRPSRCPHRRNCAALRRAPQQRCLADPPAEAGGSARAEVDHLVGARGNPAALTALRSDLAVGAYLVEWWAGAIASAVTVAERYADTGLGLADASLVALAERLGTIDMATLDERHVRAVRPLTGGEAFRLLSADA